MWPTLAATVMILSAASGSVPHPEFRSCALFWGSECCRFSPECRRPSSIICDSRNCINRSIVLGNSVTPETISSIGVSNIKTFTLGSRSMSLAALRKITIQDVEEVELQSWATSAGDAAMSIGPLSVEIQRIGTLSIGSGVFSANWSANSSVLISNIQYLKLSPTAFSPQAFVDSVVFNNISSMEMGMETFSATIGRLTFRNVSMRQCPAGSIRGTIKQIIMQGVTVNVTRTGCLEAKRGWRKFVIRDSKIGTVQKNSFLGHVEEFQMKGTTIGHIRKRGIQLNTSFCEIDHCFFDKLASNALNVTAKRGVTIQRSNVTTLRRNAFQSISVSANSAAVFNLSQLRIDQAQNRSLAFAKGTSVRLRQITFNVPCLCPTWKFAKSLLFGKSSPGKYKGLIRRVVLHSRCLQVFQNGSRVTPSLAGYGCRFCGGKCSAPTTRAVGGDGTAGAADNTGADHRRWLPFVVAAVAALLLITLCLALLLSQRRRRLYKVMDYLKRNRAVAKSADSGRRVSRPHHLDIVAVRPATQNSEDDFTDGFETDDFDDDVSNDNTSSAGDTEERTYENRESRTIADNTSKGEVTSFDHTEEKIDLTLDTLDAGYATMSELGLSESPGGIDSVPPVCAQASEWGQEHIKHYDEEIPAVYSSKVRREAATDCPSEEGQRMPESSEKRETHDIPAASVSIGNLSNDGVGSSTDINSLNSSTRLESTCALISHKVSGLELDVQGIQQATEQQSQEVAPDGSELVVDYTDSQASDELPIYAVVNKQHLNQTRPKPKEPVAHALEEPTAAPELPPPPQPIYAQVNRRRKSLSKAVSCDPTRPNVSTWSRVSARSVREQRPFSSLELGLSHNLEDSCERLFPDSAMLTKTWMDGLQMTENGLYGSLVFCSEDN